MGIEDSSSFDDINQLLRNTTEAFSGFLRAEAIKKIRLLDISSDELPSETKKILLSALSDPEAVVRAEALITLAFLYKDSILPEIMDLKTDKEVTVRSNLIAAIGYIGKWDNNDIKDFIDDCMNDTSEDIRERVARALGSMNAIDMIDPLKDMALGDRSEIVRASAIVSLGRLGYDKIKPILKQMLDLEDTSKIISIAIIDYLETISRLQNVDS